MTQPVQEPTNQRSISGLKWRTNQLERRPAPVMGAGSNLPYCYMRWIGSETIAANTISNPATIGTPDEPYEESFIWDPNFLADFSLDMATGCMEWDNPGLYYIWAQAEWNSTSTVGSVGGIVLQMGRNCSFGTTRTQNSVVFTTVTETIPIMVSRMEFSFSPSTFGNQSVRAMVFHNVGGGSSIGAVHIYIVQLNPFVDGEFFT